MEYKSFGRLISVIMRHQRIVLDHRFETYGIGSGQYGFYMAIAEKEGLNQRELSNLLKVHKGTANKAIKKLEIMGYVETRVDKTDKRLHCVYLTDKGRSILESVKEELRGYSRDLMAGIKVPERRIVYDALTKMEANVKGQVDLIRGGRHNEKGQ